MNEQKKSVLPLIALVGSVLLLLTSLGSAAFAFFNSQMLPYDAVMPIYFGFGLIGASFVIVAIVAVIVDFGWVSVSGLLASIVTVIASFGALVIIGAVMLANHPI